VAGIPKPTSMALLVALAALLSGCSGEAGSSEPGAQSVDAMDLRALTEGLPCDVPAAAGAAGTTANLRPLALDPLDDNDAVTHGEVDATTVDGRTWLLVGRYAAGGFDLVDGTDPAHPVQVSTWTPSEGGVALDAKFLADGRSVLVSASHSLDIVSLQDPAEPELEHRHTLEQDGAHMVTPFIVGGVEHVAISEAEGLDVSIFRIVGTPGDRSLERVARPILTPTGSQESAGPAHTHDTWFEDDPESGKPLLWIANAFFGVAALDVTDPANPVKVLDLQPVDPFPSYVHTVRVAHVDGRRLVAASHEYGVPALKVWDATDLSDPKLVGTWHADLPTKPQHNLQVVGDKAYVAHFADGVYVLSLAGLPSASSPVPQTLQVLAHLAPEGEGPTPRVPVGLAQDYYGARDLVVHQGFLWVAETDAGLRSVAFGCLVPGDPAASSHG
jgi:hypothetical protein